MEFEVPYNGDDRIIDYYISKRNVVGMVYGRAEDGYPQGRKTVRRSLITMGQLRSQVARLLDAGIPFNYVLNGTSHSNQEYDRVYRTAFINHVKRIRDIGCSVVTIANPILTEAVLQHVPDISIFTSIMLEIDCLARLSTFVRGRNIKYVCISKTILKNFYALEIIAKFCRKHGITPVLLTNDPCLRACPYTGHHNDTLSQMTGGGAWAGSYCRLKCTQEFINDPANIVSASFIRPEDISVYNRLGFDLFKLCDRKQTYEFLVRALDAYSAQSYDGNLSLLMAPWCASDGAAHSTPKAVFEMEFRDMPENVCRSSLRFSPSINNRALDGYLSHWERIKRHGCANSDCNDCQYCRSVAERAIRVCVDTALLNNNLSNATKAMVSLDKRSLLS